MTAPMSQGRAITSRVLTPSEAVERVEAFVERNDRISVIGIAGPATACKRSDLRYPERPALGVPAAHPVRLDERLLLPERLTDLVRARGQEPDGHDKRSAA